MKVPLVVLPECWRQCDQKLPVSVRCQNVSRVQPQAPTVPDDDTLQHFEAYVFVNARSSDMLNPNSTFTVLYIGVVVRDNMLDV